MYEYICMNIYIWRGGAAMKIKEKKTIKLNVGEMQIFEGRQLEPARGKNKRKKSDIILFRLNTLKYK